MKKISHLPTISSIIVLAFIVPQIAFAAWWNPVSWFNGWSIFRSTETKTQVLENRVKELEKRLENTATTTQVSPSVKKVENAQTPASSQSQKKPNVVIPQQTLPAAANSAVVTPVRPTVNYDALYKDTNDKYFALRTQVDHDIKLVGESLSTLSPRERIYLNFLKEFRTTLNVDIRGISEVWNVTPKPADVTNFYASKYTQVLSDFDVQRAGYDANIETQRKQSVINYLKENKLVLYRTDIHVKVAALLYLFDQLYNTKYSQDFESKKTQQETVEFANRFLIDQGESIIN